MAKRKRCDEKMKNIKGILAFIEEQKFILETTKQMKDAIKIFQDAEKAIKEAQKNLSLEELKATQDDMKKDQDELDQFFKEYEEGEIDNDKIEKKEEEKKEEKKEEKNEEKKEEKKEEDDEDKKEKENDKRFDKFKEEGINSMKDSILAIIFANDGINLEGLKRIQDQLDNIKIKQEEFNEFCKNYSDRENE